MKTATLPETPRPQMTREAERGVRRLGLVKYLNAAPLAHGLAADRRFHVERDVPSLVAERLHAGESDLGTIPSIEYAFGDYAIVPEIAITSFGNVRSVCLFLPGPLAGVRRVALDTSSRTSVALAKLLLHERLGRDPEYVPMAPDIEGMLRSADAALVIGDPALEYEGGVPRLDLGEMWRELTQLPFVWAFWAGRPDALQPGDVARLQQALRDGQAAIPEIAAAYAGARAERRAINEAYLRHNIAYRFGARERAGVVEFYRRAHAIGLAPRLPELRLYAHP